MMRNQFVATAVRGSLGVCLAVLGVFAIGIGEASALDRDIVNAKGFEPNPPFGFTTTFLFTGQLEGQSNPPGFGQDPVTGSPGVWNMSAGGTTTDAVVQSTVFAPGGGTQAVKVERNGNTSTRWGIPVNNQGYPEWPNNPTWVPPGETAQPCLCINWDMRVNPSGGDPNTDFGPFFGVEANDDDTVPLGLLGSFGLDATTGELLYRATGTGNLTPTGPIVPLGTWHNYQIKLDYSTDTYTVIYDGLPQHTETFVGGAALERFTEANILATFGSTNAADLTRTGVAFFDNFVAREGMCNVVPEPTTFVLLAMGLVLTPVVARRRRRAIDCRS